MIFAAGEGEEDKSKADNHALVVAIARAWQWQEELACHEQGVQAVVQHFTL